MVATDARAAWSCATMAPGGPCVTTAGTQVMPRWYAGSCPVAGWCRPPAGHISTKAWAPLLWTTWSVWGQKPGCGNACTAAGSPTTAATTKTPASSAQVGLILRQAGDEMTFPTILRAGGALMPLFLKLRSFGCPCPPPTHTIPFLILCFMWTLLSLH